MTHLYAIALGSNRRHGRHGSPERVLEAALSALTAAGVAVTARSPVLATAPLGPGGRRFANAAVLAHTSLDPPALLDLLKRIERAFGRRRGRRWGARVLDLDVLLWSGGRWRTRTLAVPHAGLRARRFVLDPLVTVAPGWRLPDGGTVRHAAARLTRARPLHRDRIAVGL